MMAPTSVIEITASLGEFVYARIPAQSLRTCVDSFFPGLSKDVVADCVSGAGHRWKDGHDLLVDVLPRTLKNPSGALHQAGHILLTDFPTRSGIPIPGFSANGLGKLLTEFGINKGYLSLNICDAAVGIIAISESSHDLLQALGGATLDRWSFFDTYIEGSFNLVNGIISKNPLEIWDGCQDIAAGIIRTVNTIDAMIVTIEEFFGSALSGTLIGVGISALLSINKGASQFFQNISKAGIRGMVLGGASAVSPFFAMGLAFGHLFFEVTQFVLTRLNVPDSYIPGIYQVTLEDCLKSDIFKLAWENYLQRSEEIKDFIAKNDDYASSQIKVSDLVNAGLKSKMLMSGSNMEEKFLSQSIDAFLEKEEQQYAKLGGFGEDRFRNI